VGGWRWEVGVRSRGAPSPRRAGRPARVCPFAPGRGGFAARGRFARARLRRGVRCGPGFGGRSVGRMAPRGDGAPRLRGKAASPRGRCARAGLRPDGDRLRRGGRCGPGFGGRPVGRMAPRGDGAPRLRGRPASPPCGCFAGALLGGAASPRGCDGPGLGERSVGRMAPRGDGAPRLRARLRRPGGASRGRAFGPMAAGFAARGRCAGCPPHCALGGWVREYGHGSPAPTC
jgi:hypothetical protein